MSGIVISRFVDKLPRKTAIIYALLGLAATTAFTAIAWDQTSLLCFRFLAGIFGGPTAALATTIIADAIAPQRRGKAMGILMSAFSISSAVAIPLAIYVATHTHWRFAFIAIAIMILGLLIYVKIGYQTFQQMIAKDNPQATNALLKNKAVWIAFIMLGISMGTLFAIIPNLANFFVMNRGLAVSDLSLMYFFGGVASVIGGIGGGRLTDKFGAIAICFFGSIIAICGLLLQINFDVVSIAVFYILMMGGASIRMSSVMTQLSEIPEPTQRGAFMSLQNAVRNLMMAVGSAASGLLLSTDSQGHMHGMEILSIFGIIGTLLVPFMMIYIGGYLRKRGVAY